jgi:hypothetical protein
MKNYLLVIDHQPTNFLSDSFETVHIQARNRNEAMQYARRISRQNNFAKIVSLKILK